jgi:uncharacterized protein YjbI with pentapeptide repeats
VVVVEVNGYTIEPGANLTRADLYRADLEGKHGYLNLGGSIKEAIARGELTRKEVEKWITTWTIRMRQTLLANWDSIIKDAELLHNSGGASLSSADLALFNQLQAKRKRLMDERLNHLENDLDLTQFIEELIDG